MFYVNSYVFAYKKEGIMYLRGRSMREIAIEPQISQEFINDLFNSCKELLEIEEVLGSKLTFELLNEQILISDEIDIDSRYSRTKGYYSLFYNEEYNKIQNKTVLVLGAGALGCYISLSLSMYGVRKLIVADYDIIPTLSLNSPPTLLNPLVHLDFPTIFQLFLFVVYSYVCYNRVWHLLKQQPTKKDVLMSILWRDIEKMEKSDSVF